MIDTHCHLTFPEFDGRIGAVLRSAGERGVTGAITISTTTQDCLRALQIAREHDEIWCTAGVHPLHAHEEPHAWSNLAHVAADPRCVAWGELGLDRHYRTPPQEVQLRVLSEHLGFIESHDERRLPIVLHCREAFDELIAILRRARIDPMRFVFHCFTGTPADVRKVLDFGAMVSFTGIVTYRNASEVQDAARVVPLSRIMIETDAPYLSPDPHRGKWPCEPWMASVTARRVAELRGETWEEFEAAIDENCRKFFALA